MENLQYTRNWKQENIVVTIGKTKVGREHFLLAAGPCAAENSKQMAGISAMLKDSPVKLLRGGAFKPRTSPYSFQGLGKDGLELLRQTADILNIPLVTEVTDLKHLELVSRYADALQIGSRNMAAYELLKEVGQQSKPILLKRGMAATTKEFLYAAEYVASGGNEQLILCERGIRSFDPEFRNILDLNAVALLKERTPFPVIVDPSHGSGRSDAVLPLSLAAAAAGADGVMVEIHPSPETALSDGDQSLSMENFRIWTERVSHLAQFLGKTV
ncbi:MAG: 3-deoxy-7-phosphoheptulonate synthase [Acidobacteria bacterium]|nr:MAG: 3-deoxy-7-phosphoheptulonate synthase [Acidobacteriota bacterium]RLE20041.1 MAG: 3-deoxy-7-phosphoheptulonate synthase [Acidobacteriota bacterium]